MLSILDSPKLVQSNYSYSGTADELSFSKGDVIAISKQVPGGWWEGVVNGKTGWFPANYASEVSSAPETSQSPVTRRSSSSSKESNTSQVFQSLLDGERDLVAELKKNMTTYILPLKKSAALSSADAAVLCGNYEELFTLYQELLSGLEEQAGLCVDDLRVGSVFIGLFPKFKSSLAVYSSNHPAATSVLTANSESLTALMEAKGAGSSGFIQLTAVLSKPFLNFEKYPSRLTELSRHLDEGHPDLLDLRKSTTVYQIMSVGLAELRKKKLMEWELLNGRVDNWTGDRFSTLGELLLLAQVFLEKEGVERKERYLAIFRHDLIVLHSSPRLEGYCYESRHDVRDMILQDLNDTEKFFNAISIKVSSQLWKLMSATPRDKEVLVQALSKVVLTPIKPPNDDTDDSMGQPSTVPAGTKDLADVGPKDTVIKRTNSVKTQSVPRAGMTMPAREDIQTAAAGGEAPKRSYSVGTYSHLRQVTPGQTTGNLEKIIEDNGRRWTLTCLRPNPPLIMQQKLKEESPRTTSLTLLRLSKHKAPENLPAVEDDVPLLQVIDAYYSSAKQRQTSYVSTPLSHSSLHAPPRHAADRAGRAS